METSKDKQLLFRSVQVCNKCVMIIRARKKHYYSRRIQEAYGDTRKIWGIINEVTGGRQLQRVIPDSVDNSTVEAFNTFSGIGKALADKIPCSVDSYIASSPVGNTFVMYDIELTEVVHIIKNLSTNKSAGLDQITAQLLKENVDILGPILCNIFNHCIQNEIYPSILKIAKVIPVYKNGDHSDPSSYRPISVLSVVNNIFEKLLSNRINRFLHKYMVLCPQQHGFRCNYSTSSAVLTLSQSINTALNNKLVGVVFLDLQKAFDTVDHSILLHKLKHYGLRNQAYELFSSYINNRQQAVVMNDITSTLHYLNAGVPQGSVLGPLFFSLYITTCLVY